MLFTVSLACSLSFLITLGQSFDMKLDKEQDRILWKFSGHYLYTQSGDDLQALLDHDTRPAGNGTGTNSLIVLPKTEQFANSTITRTGIWFTKHLPNRQNKFVVSYRLSHQLFKQGWISLFATRNVQVKVKTNEGYELGNFWSDGASWCDVVISEGLKTLITLEVTTPELGDYFLLDKIVMGIFENVTQLNGKTLNPCLTVPLNSSDLVRQEIIQRTSNVNKEIPKVNSLKKLLPVSVSVTDPTTNTTMETTTSTMNPTLSRHSRDFGIVSDQSVPEIRSSSDLTLAIPLDSKVLEIIKSMNMSESQNEGLQCSCSCTTNKKVSS